MADNTRTWKRRAAPPLRARERVEEQHCAQASLSAQCHFQQHALCTVQRATKYFDVGAGWQKLHGSTGGCPPKNVVFFCGGLPLIMVATSKKVMIGVQERGKFFRPHLGRLRNTLHGFAAVHVRLHTSL